MFLCSHLASIQEGPPKFGDAHGPISVRKTSKLSFSEDGLKSRVWEKRWRKTVECGRSFSFLLTWQSSRKRERLREGIWERERYTCYDLTDNKWLTCFAYSANYSGIRGIKPVSMCGYEKIISEWAVTGSQAASHQPFIDYFPINTYPLVFYFQLIHKATSFLTYMNGLSDTGFCTLEQIIIFICG